MHIQSVYDTSSYTAGCPTADHRRRNNPAGSLPHGKTALGIQLEQLTAHPGIHRVGRDIDGDIAQDLHTLVVAYCFTACHWVLNLYCTNFQKPISSSFSAAKAASAALSRRR